MGVPPCGCCWGSLFSPQHLSFPLIQSQKLLCLPALWSPSLGSLWSLLPPSEGAWLTAPRSLGIQLSLDRWLSSSTRLPALGTWPLLARGQPPSQQSDPSLFTSLMSSSLLILGTDQWRIFLVLWIWPFGKMLRSSWCRFYRYHIFLPLPSSLSLSVN